MSWLISKALMNSLSLQEQAAEYLGENFSDGEQSAPLNGNPTQLAYCAPDKMTDFSRLSRFGMTYKPLMESRGEELLTLYREAFHAKTSAQQEKAQELTENDQECGNTWRGWLAKYDPDTSLWRTAQCSLLEDLNESLETLPRSGMTRNGLLWELPMLEQTIKGTESGLSQQMWLTPRVVEIDETPENFRRRMNSKRKNDRKNGFGSLTMQVKAMFPTPTARNAKECASPSEFNRNTPTLATHAGGKLNPMWVEWLMGWPLGWTDLKPLEMDKSPSVQQQHGEF